MTIRRWAAVGAVAVGLLALSACSKPTPLATVTAGETSVHTEADQSGSCWNHGSSLSEAAISSCLTGANEKAPTTTIKVSPSEKLHLGVDPAIADTGWMAFAVAHPVSGAAQPQTITNAIKNETYTTLEVPTSTLFTDQQTGAAMKSVDLVLFKTTPQLKDATEVWKVRLELAN